MIYYRYHKKYPTRGIGLNENAFIVVLGGKFQFRLNLVSRTFKIEKTFLCGVIQKLSEQNGGGDRWSKKDKIISTYLVIKRPQLAKAQRHNFFPSGQKKVLPFSKRIILLPIWRCLLMKFFSQNNCKPGNLLPCIHK